MDMWKNGILRFLVLGFYKYIHLVYLPIYFDLVLLRLSFLKYMGSLSKSDPKFKGKERNAYKFSYLLRGY